MDTGTLIARLKAAREVNQGVREALQHNLAIAVGLSSKHRETLAEYVKLAAQNISGAAKVTSQKKKHQPRLRLVVSNESLGYKSGRKSCRETPENASSESTRSAGTRPELRHFCNAWYRTPNFSDSGRRPPPAAIARSTGFMPPSLQLAGVTRQQPARVISICSMQLMVADAKEAADRAFSAELNRQLTERDVKSLGRPAQLVKDLKKAGLKISITSCQKWLGGKQIPRGWKLRVLIETYNLDAAALMTAANISPDVEIDDQASALASLLPKIPDKADRDALVRMAYRLAGMSLPETSQPQAHQPHEPAVAQVHKKTASKR